MESIVISDISVPAMGFDRAKITHLRPNDVFVFGSNLAGKHGGGAAKTANKYLRI